MEKEKPRSVVSKYFGEEGGQLFEDLFRQGPEYADAIIFLQGDRFDRAPAVQSLYEQGYAEHILITGNNNLIGRGKRDEENDIHLSKLKRWLIEHEVPEKAILVDEQSLHTKGQAIRTIELAKENGWSKLLVVTSPYHVLRSYLTFQKQIKVQDWHGKIIMHTAVLPWEGIPSGRVKNAREMLVLEMKKLQKYANDLVTIQEGMSAII